MDWWNKLDPSERHRITLVLAVAAGAAVMYLLCSHRGGHSAPEGLYRDPEVGIYAGPSEALLRRTGGARWEGRYPIVYYDPNTELRFAGSGCYRFNSYAFEIINIVHGQMAVRVLPYKGRAEDWWDVDLWIDARQFSGPWPDDIPRTRWRHLYRHLEDRQGGGGMQGKPLKESERAFGSTEMNSPGTWMSAGAELSGDALSNALKALTKFRF